MTDTPLVPTPPAELVASIGSTVVGRRREIELVCPVESIPAQIDVDLASVEIGDSVHISAITLPANVTPTITDRDFTICAVVGRGPSGEEEEEGGEGGEAESETDED